MSDAVKLSWVNEEIALLVMNRPDSRNAFSDDIKDGLRDAAMELKNSTALKALIFTGSGGSFCAGGDLKAMLKRHELKQDDKPEDVKHRMESLHAWLRILRDLPVPVIVAVDGPAVGAGMGLALIGDIVLASETAVFSASFAKVGAAPDCNLMWSLPRVVGLQRAKELFYTARMVNAKEALAMGLCLEVLPQDKLIERAKDLAAQMLNVSSDAFRLTKQITGRAMESESDDILQAEVEAQMVCLTSDYHFDAVRRFAAKERLKFDFK